MTMSLKSFFFHIFIFSIFIGGLYDVIYNREDNRCEMTYMFEYPRFQQIPVEDNSDYKLFIYGEGEYFGRIRNLKLKGIPILYIPGHAGSYKQVRSLASVLLRKSFSRDHHFNVFTIDFNEQFSAVHGSLLRHQTNYVSKCISTILNLYKSNVEVMTSSVAIVAHSMGGMIARDLFTLPNFNPRDVNVIITMATPHQAPVVNIDYVINNFYKRVNHHWMTSSSLNHVTLISIAGGSRDIQVTSSLAHLPNVTSSALSVVTSSIPRVHLTTDHLCIVWCKQLVLVTSRFFYDVIDSKTHQITDDVIKREQIARFHFLRHPGFQPDVISSDIIITTKINKSFPWHQVMTSSRCWSSRDEIAKKMTSSSSGIYFAFSIRDLVNRGVDDVIIRTHLAARDSWILATQTFGPDAVTAIDLSRDVIIAPNYRIIHIKLRELMTSSNWIVMMTSRTRLRLLLEVNALTRDELSMTSSALSPLRLLYNAKMMTSSSPQCPNRFYYRIDVDDVTQPYHVISARVVGDDVIKTFSRSEVTWDEGATQFGDDVINVNIRTPPIDQKSLRLHFYLEKSLLRHHFEIQFEIFKSFASLILQYSSQIFVSCVINLSLILNYMTSSISSFKDLYTIHNDVINPIALLPILIAFPASFPVSLILIFFGSLLARIIFIFHLIFIFIFKIPSRLIPSKLMTSSLLSSMPMTSSLLHALVLGILLNFAPSIAPFYFYLMTFLRVTKLQDQMTSSSKNDEKVMTSPPENQDEVMTSSENSSPVTSSSENEDNLVTSPTREPVTSSPTPEVVTSSPDLFQRVMLMTSRSVFCFLVESDDDVIGGSGDSVTSNHKRLRIRKFRQINKMTSSSLSDVIITREFLLLNFWFYFMVFSIPPLIAISDKSKFEEEPMISLVACVIFFLQSMTSSNDVIISWKVSFVMSIIIVVMTASSSLYLLPHFILALMTTQLVPLFIK